MGKVRGFAFERARELLLISIQRALIVVRWICSGPLLEKMRLFNVLSVHSMKHGAAHFI